MRAKQEREEDLARALRANLQRRKEQARARAERPASDENPAENGSEAEAPDGPARDSPA